MVLKIGGELKAAMKQSQDQRVELLTCRRQSYQLLCWVGIEYVQKDLDRVVSLVESSTSNGRTNLIGNGEYAIMIVL